MYSKILVPVDGSAPAALGLQEAIKLARALNASIRLLHVIDGWVMLSSVGGASNYEVIADVLKRGGAELLKEAEAAVRRAGIDVDTVLVEATDVSTGECIVEKAREFNADLIVCGTHGRRGIRRILMGSDAEYILRHAPVPLLMVRAQEAGAAQAAAHRAA